MSCWVSLYLGIDLFSWNLDLDFGKHVFCSEVLNNSGLVSSIQRRFLQTSWSLLTFSPENFSLPFAFSLKGIKGFLLDYFWKLTLQSLSDCTWPLCQRYQGRAEIDMIGGFDALFTNLTVSFQNDFSLMARPEHVHWKGWCHILLRPLGIPFMNHKLLQSSLFQMIQSYNGIPSFFNGEEQIKLQRSKA